MTKQYDTITVKELAVYFTKLSIKHGNKKVFLAVDPEWNSFGTIKLGQMGSVSLTEKDNIIISPYEENIEFDEV